MLRLSTAESGGSATPLRHGNMDRVSGDATAGGLTTSPGRGAVGPGVRLVATRLQPGSGPGAIAASLGESRMAGSGGQATGGASGRPTGKLGGVEVERRARLAVALENRLAAGQAFDPADPRWVLALRAAEVIEGGRAAVLPPEKRARLLGLATRLGLRPFDAHLVMAIVQDGARTGQGPLAQDVSHRLALVTPVRPGADGLDLAMRLVAVGLLATAIAGAMIAWIVGV